MLQRIKDITCSTLRLRSSCDASWEAGLTRAINANAYEHINFLRAKDGCRVLFMPHSPGIYIALVLKNSEEIAMDHTSSSTENYLNNSGLGILSEKSMNVSNNMSQNDLSIKKSQSNSESGPSVKRLIIKNNLFLDVDSLSKNLQTILKSYQMIVIAKLKGVTKHEAKVDSFNPFELEDKETFFLCQIEKIEHIVGFEGDDFDFTDYACK